MDAAAVQGELRADKALFSESSGFVMEARQGSEQALEELFAGYGLDMVALGTVTDTPQVQVNAREGAVSWSLAELKDAWSNGLAAVLR